MTDKATLLEKALVIAIKAHFGQKDRAGQPYILHVIRVMEKCESLDEKIVATLHDLIEDTDWTSDQLLQEGFPQYIVDAVVCLTKGDNEPYDDYINRVKPNPLAVRVKLSDLKDNSNPLRLHTINEQDIERYNRYLKAYAYLSEPDSNV